MNPKNYIISSLDALRNSTFIEDISDISLESALFNKIMSKKFRKLKPHDEAVKITKDAIKIAINEQKPIRIVNMFGGNKLWRFEEAPEIDWAELFSLIYFVQWSRLIASVYKPGVIYEYFSQDISVESLNNIPRSETDRYSETFRELLEFIRPYLPPNIKVTYTRHYDLFKNPNDYYKEIDAAKKKILDRNKGKLPVMDQNMYTATELNVNPTSDQKDDPLWREKVELEHQAIFETKTLRNYCDVPGIIWTCPTFYPDCIVTGSTKRSFAKFWAAVGVLKRERDSFVELVLTPKQLELAKFTWEDIDIQGLKGKNFKRIRILI